MRSNFNMEYENITMTKGDTLAFNVEVFDQNGQPVTVDSADFTCKKDATGEDAVFHQTLGAGIAQSDGILSIRVAPEETMEADAGEYFYDLQLGVNNDVYTVKSGLLTIQQDVTHGNEATGYYDWSMINNKPFNTIGDNLEVDENMVLKAVVPTQLSQLEGDSGHRTVTDTQILTWNGKQDTLTFDQVPTDQSQNPVKSDGIYDSILGVYDALELGLGWDSKNILEIVQSDRENGGITYTFDKEAGTVKLNGTSTGSAVALNKFTGAELKKYGQNLWMSGGRDTSTFLTLATSNWAYTKDDKGTGVEINISELNDYAEYFVLVQVSSGTVLSNYTMYPMIELVSLTDRRFAPYHGSVDEVKADKTEVIADTELLKETVGWTNKNELDCLLETTTATGITITANADKTYTLNGTATAQTDFYLRQKIGVGMIPMSLEDGDYTFTILTKNENIKLVMAFGGSSTSGYLNGEFGTGYVDFNIDHNDSVRYGVRTPFVRVANGATLNNVVIYPMIVKKGIVDLSFEAFRNTTAFPRDEQDFLGAKQLIRFPYKLTTHTELGITFTVDDDGVVDLDGTSTAQQYVMLHLRGGQTDNNVVILPKGKYTYSNDEVISGLNLYVNKTVSGNSETILNVNDKEGTFELTETTQIGIGFIIQNGASFSHKKFYPLLTLATDRRRVFAPFAMTNYDLTKKLVFDSVLYNSVTVNANSFITRDLPTKTGYKIAMVTPCGSGSGFSNYGSIGIGRDSEGTPTTCMIRNRDSSDHTFTVTCQIMYVKA